MKDVRTVVFEKCYVMSKMFRGGGGFDQDALGMEDSMTSVFVSQHSNQVVSSDGLCPQHSTCL